MLTEGCLPVNGQPASSSHDKRTSPTNLQPPTASAIGSGAAVAAINCPCGAVAALQVAMQRVFRNKTSLTKRRASSRHSRSAKGQTSSKHAGELKFFLVKPCARTFPTPCPQPEVAHCVLFWNIGPDTRSTMSTIFLSLTRFLDTYPQYRNFKG